MKKYLPALVAGFGAGVLHVVPIAKGLTCCLVIPIAAVIAIMLEQKANNLNIIDLRRGVYLGLFTGIFAALFGSFFDVFITYITKSNDILIAYNELHNVLDSFPVPENIKEEVMILMHEVTQSIKETGFSAIYAISIIINNLIVDSVFGLIGGLAGTKILNSRNS